MKTKKLLIVLMLITLIPMTSLFAQRTPGSFGIGGFVGTGMPLSPDFFKDYWTSGGIGFGGELVYNFSEKIALGVRFHRLPFPLDEDSEILDMIKQMLVYQGVTVDKLEGMDINTNIITANLLAYLTPPDAAAGFYVTGGASYYQLSMSDIEISGQYMGQQFDETMEMDEEIDDKFGINAGAGVEFNAGGSLNIFAEGRYHYMFEKEEGPMEEDSGSISFISIVAGIRFFM